jgi:hypothetical protein
MSACSGIRADGGRCQAQAMRNSEWCINHHPHRAEVRRRRASKGGKRGGRGRPIAELGSLRDENADIRRRLLEGELLPNVAGRRRPVHKHRYPGRGRLPKSTRIRRASRAPGGTRGGLRATEGRAPLWVLEVSSDA